MNARLGKRKLRREGGSVVHVIGCRCSRSRCTKKYCECYKQGIQCTTTCACVGCENGKLSSTSMPAYEDAQPASSESILFDSLLLEGLTST